jgi:hypothetical protein
MLSTKPGATSAISSGISAMTGHKWEQIANATASTAPWVAIVPT